MFFAVPVSGIVGNTLFPYAISQMIGFASEGAYELAQTAFYAAAAVGFIGVLANFIGFKAAIIHEGKVITKLRNATYRNLISKDMSFFTNKKVGGITSKYLDFVRSHVALQDLLILRTIGFTISILIGIGVLAMQSLVIAAVVMAFLTILIIQIQWSIKYRTEYRKLRRDMRSTISGHVADTITNYSAVKMFASENREIATMEKYGKKFNYAYKKDIGFLASEGSARVALMMIVQVITLGFCLHYLQQGAIDIATTVFAASYLQFMGNNIFALADILNGYEQNFTDAAPMTQMLLTKNGVTDAPDATSPTIKKPSITLNAVSFSYGDDAEPVLNNLSLAIPAGQKVGVVGHSGAGKSTLAHLLLRFNDVTDGSISFGTHDIRTLSQQALRDTISFVPQDSSLFHRSLRENIAYGKPDATEKQIIAAAKKAHAWDFIKDLPDGLDTKVGERGVKLSGGQRQRIAIARAILKDAPLLVLDEATSALDSKSEQSIQESLEHLMKQKTTIAIAHRLSTLQKMDRIIVMENGTIAEDGTHDELLALNGIYAELWAHQSGGFLSK